jgi:hypothetical protein
VTVSDPAAWLGPENVPEMDIAKVVVAAPSETAKEPSPPIGGPGREEEPEVTLPGQGASNVI